MTRLLTFTAVAALFATAASAQMAPSFEPSADNCKKPQYSTTDECKNFLEGRSSTEGTQKPGGTVGSSQSPGNSSGGSGSGSGSGGAGSGGAGPN
jgi:hypothetical protein